MTTSHHTTRAKRPWRIEYRLTDMDGDTSEWRRIRGAYSSRENAQRALDGNLGWYLSHAYKHETRIVERVLVVPLANPNTPA